MGMDWETQASGQVAGLKMNGGTFDFSSGSSTCDVATTLAKVKGGLATAKLSRTTYTPLTTLGLVVGDASNGKITFVRAGGQNNEDACMAYWLVGY